MATLTIMPPTCICYL